MSVEITFHPVGLSGLVATGTYVLDAAKQMGVRLPVDCKGPDQCRACLVSILEGESLLSQPTAAELIMFGQSPGSEKQRLACHARIERDGELVVQVMSEKKVSETDQKDAKEVRSTFGELPLDKKLATLVQLEVLTVSAAFDAVVDRSIVVGERFMDFLARQGKSKQRHDLAARRPPEHRREKSDRD